MAFDLRVMPLAQVIDNLRGSHFGIPSHFEIVYWQPTAERSLFLSHNLLAADQSEKPHPAINLRSCTRPARSVAAEDAEDWEGDKRCNLEIETRRP